MPSDRNPLNCSKIGPDCLVQNSIYGYYPSLSANAFFLAIFALCGLLQVFLGWRYKTWTYLIAMGFGCLAQAIGYFGRILLHNNPYNIAGFNVQICCLTIAPAFNSAAIYLILKHVVRTFGREESRLRPKYFTWIFIVADFFALCFQGSGGGIAATAGNNNSLRSVGDDLMMTGISWQVATLVVFGGFVIDYILRRRGSGRPLSPEAQAVMSSTKFQVFAVGLVVTYFAVLIRCCYRIAEMAGGWQNPIMQDETLFIGLDSVMVSLATVLQTALHPGIFFPALADSKNRKMADSTDAEKRVGDTSSDEEI